MTFFHAINCAVLTYAPLFILFKYTSIQEICGVRRCLNTAAIYFVTQFIKLLVVATIYPDYDTESLSITSELVRSSADIFDVLGMYFCMRFVSRGRGEVCALSTGYGFAVGHTIGVYLVPLIYLARDTSFHSSYIQSALEANIDIFFHIGLAFVVWNYYNKGSNLNRTICGGFIALAILKTSIYAAMINLWGLTSWTLLLAKFAYTAGISIFSVSNLLSSAHSSY